MEMSYTFSLQSYVFILSQGFDDGVLGDSPCWWADTVATYCPSRPSQLLAPTVTKHCNRRDEYRCTLLLGKHEQADSLAHLLRTFAMYRVTFNFAPEVRGRLRDESRERRRGRHCGRGRRRGRRGDHAGGRRPVRERVLAVVAEDLHVELKVQLARHHRVRHLHLELLPPEGPVGCEGWGRNICLIQNTKS